MLPKSLRLSRRDFLIAKKLGRPVSTPYLSAIVFQHSAFSIQHSAKYSVVTSSKLSKKAVIRNRLRRQIYDQFSVLSAQFSGDLILFPRATMLKLTRDQISTELNTLLSKISQLS